jgi:hypothetical protein
MIIISFILFSLILALPFLKRTYRRRQQAAGETHSGYNEARSEQPKTLLHNVVSLKEYKERRHSNIS